MNVQLAASPAQIHVKLKRLRPVPIPTYATEGAAGFDIAAAEDVIIPPGATVIVPSGLAVELPAGYELQLRPRSGISAKTRLRIANAPGTIDSDFRAEIGVIVDNLSEHADAYGTNYLAKTVGGSRSRADIVSNGNTVDPNTCIIRKGDRIAQGVIAPVYRAAFEEVDELSDTERGAAGFGSTGTRYEDDGGNTRCTQCGGKVEGGYCDCQIAKEDEE